jgi:hypothetical protein
VGCGAKSFSNVIVPHPSHAGPIALRKSGLLEGMDSLCPFSDMVASFRVVVDAMSTNERVTGSGEWNF